MAFNPDIKIYLIDRETGDYYIASKSNENVYSVTTTPTETAILTLPDGWDNIKVQWDRDPHYLGVFTGQSQVLKFALGARAILLSLYYAAGGGIQAECTMRVDAAVGFSYETAYTSEIDFSHVVDQKLNGDPWSVEGIFQASTMDSKLLELLKAYGDTSFNIPMYTSIGPGLWITDATYVWHSGIKLLYSTTLKGSAKPDSLSHYHLAGWESGAPSGAHTMPAMFQYNPVANNGSTTYIGNDILQKLIIQGNQSAVMNGDNFNFETPSGDRCYTKNSYCLLDQLVTTDGTGALSPADIHMSVQLTGQFHGNINYNDASHPTVFIDFVLFAIGSDNLPEIDPITGNAIYELLLHYPLPPGTTYTPPDAGLFDSGLVPLTIKYNKAYVLGFIYDFVGAGAGGTFDVQFNLSDIQISFLSNYNSGSAAPVDAPMFPGSVIAGFKPHKILEKLVPMLNSGSTDQFGFPVVPPGTPYTGESTFLATDATVHDNSPARTLIFSANAMQLLPGYPYISLSLNDFFKTCFNTWGCGLELDGDKVVIDKLETFFDNSGPCIDLKNNVANLKIEPLTSIMNCHIRAGYNNGDTNKDMGVDGPHKEIEFNTPLTKVAGTSLDLVTTIIADMYITEKRRSQQITTAIPTSGLPGGQSGGNETYMIEFSNEDWPIVGTAYDPSGNPFAYTAKKLQQYPNAQNSDPTASVAEYIYGLFYPETATNMGLTPDKCILRLGAYLHSMLDGLDDFNLIYRKVYQMLYNNTSELIPGIATNLTVGGAGTALNEIADIPISSLGTPLFRPYKLTIETSGPVNMYSVMTTPAKKKYVQFDWKNKVWKGYIAHVEQNLALNKPTSFELWCHPDVTNEMLINS